MQRIILSDPEANETPEQICDDNLKMTDKCHNLEYFIFASQAWMKMNPTKNYQDFEKFLRDNNFKINLDNNKRLSKMFKKLQTNLTKSGK